ncbi:HEAT repeat domain-containing protein [Spirillospora sp. NPDC052269]
MDDNTRHSQGQPPGGGPANPRAQYAEAARGVIAELNELGYPVGTVQQLRTLPGQPKYPDAIPVLLKWLPQVSYLGVKLDIINALDASWARSMVVEPLLGLFRELGHTPLWPDDQVQWALGDVLRSLARDDIADELLQIAADSGYGRNRQSIVRGLAKLRDARVPGVLIELLRDEDDAIVANAAGSLGRSKTSMPEARQALENLHAHPSALVRREASKALVKLAQ